MIVGELNKYLINITSGLINY